MFHAKKRRGVAVIEFAFWLPFAAFLMAGLLDFSWFMSRNQNVMEAARDGARQGVAGFDDPDTGANEQIDAAIAGAQATIDGLGMACGAPVATFGSAVGMDTLQVEVRCPFTPLIGAYPGMVGSPKVTGLLPNEIVHRFTMFTEIQAPL